ncbi:MAG: hypothetical protein CM1200mP25_4050 [Acidobacteriota bacterium]|nr:MAG: hypothetical protein CM1200mP25_4050 [Acidobacteriota bacterium]
MCRSDWDGARLRRCLGLVSRMGAPRKNGRIEARRCHVVENRCVHVGVSVVARFFPAVVVTHKEDNVRSVLSVVAGGTPKIVVPKRIARLMRSAFFIMGVEFRQNFIRPLNDMNGLKATRVPPDCLTDDESSDLYGVKPYDTGEGRDG